MPSIADLYVTVMPETSKIADGIVRAFREVDPKATEAGRRWGREIQRGMDDVKVELKADTTKAKAEVDEAARDRHSTIHLDVDKDRFGQTVQNELAQMGPRMSGAAASSGASIGSSMGAALAPALMTAGITALAGLASAASGLVGLMPAGLAGAGSVIGTLAIGLDGVKDAWDAAGKAADSSGKDQESKAKAVADATKSLKDAVIDEAMAQKDVANARKDARQQLEDLNVQLRGGAIDEKQAVLDAAAARRDLMTGRFKDSIEYQQAQLRVQQADQRVLESHERQVQLQQKASEANAQGVEGSDRVVAANQRLEKANDSVAAAQRNLADAQKKTSSEADTAARAMAKLSPAAAAFVGTLVQMKPLWEGFKNSVQDALFANMGPQIRQLATTYMPMLTGSFTTMASLINQAATQFMAFMQRPESMMLMQTLLNNINTSFQAFLPTLQTLTGAFLQMTATGSSFLPQLGQIFGQLATMFAGFVNSGQFSQWMQTGLLTLQQLTNMLPTVLQMFTALAPIGNAALGGLGQILTALQPAIAPLSNLFAAFITNGVTPMLTLLAQLGSTIIAALAPAFTQWFQTMGPVANMLISALQPVFQALGPVLAQTAQVLLGALIPAVQQLIPFIGPLVQQVALWFQAMLPLLPSLMQLATTAIPPITAALTVLLPLLTKFVDISTTIASTVIPPLTTVLGGLADAYSRVWDTISRVTETVWNKIKPILDRFKDAIHDLHIDDLLEALGFAGGGSPSIPTPTAPAPAGAPGATPTAGIPALPGAPFPRLSELRGQQPWLLRPTPTATLGGGLLPLMPAAPAIGGAPTTLAAALAAKGFTPEQIRLIEGFSQVEGRNPAGNPTLGFNDAQLGGRSDLQSHVDALAQQFKDRAAVAGPFPSGGTDEQQAQWIAKVVGQHGAPGEPSLSEYVRRVVTAMQGTPAAAPGVGAALGAASPTLPSAAAPSALSSMPGGVNLSTIPVAVQKYANDCIDASARIILSHSGVNMDEDQLERVIAPGGTIQSQAAGMNQLSPQGKFVAMPGSGGSQQAMFNAIKASIDNGTGSILNVAPGSSIAGKNFSEGHFIAVTGYNADGTINLSDTAGGKKYSVSAADAFQATAGRGIVAGTGSGPSPSPGALDISGMFPSAGMPTIANPAGVSPNGIPLGSQQSPMYVMPAQSNAAQQFGQDFLGGFLEIFGLDGSVFKNPLGSGLFKGFKGIMSMLSGGGQGGRGGYPASAFGGDGAALPPLGGGGGALGGIGSLLSGFIPAATAPAGGGKQADGGPTFHIQQNGMFLDQPQATDQIRQAAYTGTAWHNSMTSPAIMA